jgi:hypothetical protein
MARKRPAAEEQGSLFDAVQPRRTIREPVAASAPQTPKDGASAPRKWQMPALEGKTVAEIRLRWPKRLTPAQVTRVEAELGALPKLMSKLGFGTVVVERAFVRRRKL